MEKLDKTIYSVDVPIDGPEERTITSFSISDDRKRVVIESSHELRCDALVQRLQSSWDMLTDDNWAGRVGRT